MFFIQAPIAPLDNQQKVSKRDSFSAPAKARLRPAAVEGHLQETLVSEEQSSFCAFTPEPDSV